MNHCWCGLEVLLHGRYHGRAMKKKEVDLQQSWNPGIQKKI